MKSIDKSPRGRVINQYPNYPGEIRPPPTKLKNQFPTHFLFIVNSTILYKNKNPFQEKKMKSIDKSPRVSSPEWSLPGCVDYSIHQYSDLWKK